MHPLADVGEDGALRPIEPVYPAGRPVDAVIEIR